MGHGRANSAELAECDPADVGVVRCWASKAEGARRWGERPELDLEGTRQAIEGNEPLLKARREDASDGKTSTNQVRECTSSRKVNLNCHTDDVIGVAQSFNCRGNDASKPINKVADVVNDERNQLFLGGRNWGCSDEQVERILQDWHQQAAEGVADGTT